MSLKHLILKILYFLTYWIGINKLFYFLNRHQQRVLTYHNVLPDEVFDNTLHLGVSHDSNTFDKQISYIVSQLDITTDLGKENSCVITFDDGYRNNFIEAHSILKEYNAKAYFFIPVNMILNNEETLWIDQILMWISYVPDGLYPLTDLGIVININDVKSRQQMFSKVWTLLLKNYDKKDILLNEMQNSYAFEMLDIHPDIKKLRFNGLTQDQLFKMKNYGHKIGCHSIHHDILSKLGYADLESDIKESEYYLDSLFNTNIYSYPFGGVNEVSKKVIQQLKKSKFSNAMVNISEPLFPYNKYAIPRISLPNSSDKYLIDAKLSGFEYFLKYLKLLPSYKDSM